MVFYKMIRTGMALSLAGLTMLVACRKEIDTAAPAQPRDKQLASFSNDIISKRAWLREQLQQVALPIVKLAKQSASVRQGIYAEVRKAVDGETNGLVELIRDNVPQLGNNSQLTAALQAFDNIEGTKYFPQVFIPNYYELAEDGKTGTGDIIVVFYDGDESLQSVQGYKLGANDSWQPATMIDEAFTGQHEVWVFSLNEHFENFIDYGKVLRPSGPPAPKPTGTPQSPYIDHVTVRQHKESIFAGGSDLYMRTYTTWNTAMAVSPYKHATYAFWVNDPNNGLDLETISRADVTNRQINSVYKVYIPDWDPGLMNVNGEQGDVMMYVMYEKDSWPTGRKNTEIEIRGYTFSIDYRSADIYYSQGFMTHYTGDYYMDGYVHDEIGLKFNSEL